MASSAADRFVGGGGGGGDEPMLLHHPQMYDHVPQHSRREKLRFPLEGSSPPSASFLLLHDADAAPSLYPANSLTAFLPSSSSSSSYYSHNPTLNYGDAQFDGHGALPIPAQHQIPIQGFSLSLTSSSSPRPPASRHHLASRPAPLGPFTGYAAVLNRSRFLEPARKLLEEVCRAGHQAAAGSGGGSREMLLDADPPRESLMDHGVDVVAGHGTKEDRAVAGTEQQWKKTRLISMLDEVYRRYKQCYQQVQAVIASFESVAGLSTASPYASMALKAMSKHFKCLKNIISGQLRQTSNKGHGDEGVSREDISSFGLLNSSNYLQKTTNSPATFAQPHVWRPQRGLPERAVSVLRAWLFEHFLHPYPTDVDKQNLAKQTGLTRNQQVSNWFINARVRLWKPMVEEVHSLELRQKNKTSASGGSNCATTDEQPQPPPSSRSNPLSSPQFQVASICRNQNSVTEGIHEELTSMRNHIQGGPVNFVYDMSNHQHVAGGASVVAAGGNGNGNGNGVSLTLGLHQDSGVCFSEPLPLNVARRFGLEECNDTYLVSSFGAQERQFGKDVIGGRLLHS
ncbi:unnamed protein product [Musa acuminata subsp. malaccensis]|uniref:(wild Malaysian banana) hypothetical protein n=1 Tax=Musa acuminata subsp. malaccensis TaxID=214687 RepID=A0A8D7F2M3_MUSAM|nr:unnamed protein product [Musa acuminata subsp. malaccensis]